jgi:hypothetical protein
MERYIRLSTKGRWPVCGPRLVRSTPRGCGDSLEQFERCLSSGHTDLTLFIKLPCWRRRCKKDHFIVYLDPILAPQPLDSIFSQIPFQSPVTVAARSYDEAIGNREKAVLFE